MSARLTCPVCQRTGSYDVLDVETFGCGHYSCISCAVVVDKQLQSPTCPLCPGWEFQFDGVDVSTRYALKTLLSLATEDTEDKMVEVHVLPDTAATAFSTAMKITTMLVELDRRSTALAQGHVRQVAVTKRQCNLVCELVCKTFDEGNVAKRAAASLAMYEDAATMLIQSSMSAVCKLEQLQHEEVYKNTEIIIVDDDDDVFT